jgi:hypothetical protein
VRSGLLPVSMALFSEETKGRAERRLDGPAIGRQPDGNRRSCGGYDH